MHNKRAPQIVRLMFFSHMAKLGFDRLTCSLILSKLAGLSCRIVSPFIICIIYKILAISTITWKDKLGQHQSQTPFSSAVAVSDIRCPYWACLDLTWPDSTCPDLACPDLTCPDLTCSYLPFRNLTDILKTP